MDISEHLYKRIKEYISKIEAAQSDLNRYLPLLDAAINVYKDETSGELPQELKERVLALGIGYTHRGRQVHRPKP